MSSETYAILFKGGVVDGHDPAAVQAQLARLLKLNPQKTKALFSGKQIILKKTADKAEAAKYGKALKKAGAPHVFKRYPKMGHMGINQEVIDRTLEFIKEQSAK